jgi:hypothetical protein
MLDVRCSMFISFLFDRTGCPLAGGRARMKLHSKFVWERFATAIKIDRIPLFNAYSPPEEDSLVSFIDQTGRFLARGRARVKLQKC